MTSSLRCLTLAGIFAATSATAEMHEDLGTGILVSDPQYCDLMVDVDPEEHVWRVIEAGGETLDMLKLSAPEVDCWFEKEISFSWQGQPTQLTLAACYVADMVQPTIFAIDMYPEVPGEVTVWQQGADMPTRFYTCTAPN